MKRLLKSIFAFGLTLTLTACGTAFTNQDLEKPELAYEYINICYVSNDGTIESESVYLPCVVQTIFDEWAARNSIDDVSVVETRREDNSQTIYPDDPGGTSGVITHIPADYAVLYITLSPEFEAYSNGENGQLIVETLERTFLDYYDYNEIHILIGS